MNLLFSRPDDGWWPWVSPDGAYVAYGATVGRVLVVATGEERLIGDGLPCGWLDAQTLLCHRMAEQGDLYTVSMPDGTILPYPVADATTLWRLGATGAIVARDGHWATWTGGRVSWDGAWLPTPVEAHTVDCAGDWVVHGGGSSAGWAFYVYCRGQFQREFLSPLPTCNVFGIADDGTVVYGAYQYLRLNFSDGRDIDARCAGNEQAGSFMRGPDGLWLWTFACADTMYACGRPATGQRACVLTEGAYLHTSAGLSADGSMVVAGHDDVGRLLVSRVANAPLTEWVPPPAPPAPTPSASFTLDRTEGPVPLTVTATLTRAHLTTWRWLLDGAIHQPIEGDTHQFVITTPGTHTIGLRTSPPTDVWPETVTAHQGAPVQAPFCGVQVGFGYPVGAERMLRLKARQWEVMRVGIDHQRPDRTTLQACVQEVVDAGLTPLVLIPVTAQINGTTHWCGEWVPDGLDLEYYGPTQDLTGGQEADNRGEDPVKFAEAIAVAMPYHRAHGHRVWAPALSNPSKPAFSWLTRFVQALDRLGVMDVGISVHRYPDYGMRRGGDGRRGFASLRDEINTLKRIIGGRPWAMTEGDWHTGVMWKWQGDLFKWLRIGRYRLTDQQVVENTVTDWTIMREMGCRFAIWYQVGQSEDGGTGEGLYTVDGREKPQLGIAERVEAV